MGDELVIQVIWIAIDKAAEVVGNIRHAESVRFPKSEVDAHERTERPPRSSGGLFHLGDTPAVSVDVKQVKPVEVPRAECR